MGSRQFFLLLNGAGIVVVPLVCVGLRVGLGLMGWMFIIIAGLCISVVPGVFLIRTLLSLLLADQPRRPDGMLVILWVIEVLALWFAVAVMPDFGDTGPAVVSPLMSALPVSDPEAVGQGLGVVGIALASIAALLWVARVIWLRSCFPSQR